MTRTDHGEPARTVDKNLLVIFGITLTAILGVSSISPAFPKIIRELGVSPREIGLLITAFTLPGVVMTPVLGILADRFGRKRILIPALLLFGVAGVACALARDFTLLVILRFIQGLGAASLGSLNVTLLGDLYSGPRRAAAMGYNASVLSIGTAGYPIIGGALATIQWYVPFLLPVVAFPVILAVLFVLDNPDARSDQQLVEYLRNAWKHLKNRAVGVLFAASLMTFIILYGALLTYFPLFLEERFGFESFTIGLIISSASISTAITSSQVGRLAKRFKPRSLLCVTFFLYGLAMVLVPFVHQAWMLFVPTIIFGMGNGLNIPTIQTALAGLAPMQVRGAVMSLNGMVLRLGQTLGPVVMGGVYAVFGLEATFFAGMVSALAMLAILWTFDFSSSTH